MTSTSTRRALVALATATALLPTAPALAQTAPDSPPPVTVTADAAATTPTSVSVNTQIIDYGGTVTLTARGDAGQVVDLYIRVAREGQDVAERVIRTATLNASGSFTWVLRPGDTTTFFAQPRGGESAGSVQVRVRRAVTIGISQANGIYAFSGQITRSEAGVQVTVARLDAVSMRVTGVASTRTTSGGQYVIRTALPVGQAGYYALTSGTSALAEGRSRLYGLIVPARVVVAARPAPAQVSPTVTIGARAAGGNVYTLSGQVTPGRSVPVTLAEIRSGRPVGVAGGRAGSDGRYSFNVTLNQETSQTTRIFQVLTAAGQGLRAANSRQYGLVVPARRVVLTPAAETASQTNARLKGADYLEFSAFSRSGLIRQLEFEGFSTADATYGTDAQRANWSVQAARSARQYLNFTSFSRQGLIDQLVFEGFSRAEAEYGVRQVGL